MQRASKVFRGVNLSIIQGDLTNERVDAIVNAANQQLAHAGGVAAAIVKKGGFIIQQESDKYIKTHGRVKTGTVGLTSGGKLHCRYVIHAVGPVFNGDLRADSEVLKKTVLNSFRKAEEFSLKSISLPAISSGIFGFPKDVCAEVLIKASLKFITSERKKLEIIRFVNFDELTANIFLNEFQKFMNNEQVYLSFLEKEQEITENLEKEASRETQEVTRKLVEMRIEDEKKKENKRDTGKRHNNLTEKNIFEEEKKVANRGKSLNVKKKNPYDNKRPTMNKK